MPDERNNEEQPSRASQHLILARACHECRRKKTKCDMARPMCGLCRRNGHDCNFPTKRKRPSLPRKPQMSPNIVGLEGNIDRLISILSSPDAPDLLRSHFPLTQPSSMRPADALTMDNVSMPNGSPLASFLEHFAEFRSETSLDARNASPVQPGDQQSENGSAQDSSLVITQDHAGNASLVDEMVPYELAIDLIDTFFQKIQPWLPLLHKPRFLSYCEQHLKKDGPNALAGLPVDMTLLLYSLFALSARYSQSARFKHVEPRDRDVAFMCAARRSYNETRVSEVSSLRLVQGYLLLAFNTYTSELSSKAWILTGVCVRLAYEMELFEIDEPTSQPGDLDEVHKEEMRRAWWLIWELDTYGSIARQRPFAIDRHHFSVNLPVSDEAWFSGNMPSSSTLITPLDQCWMSLLNVPNQAARAWFLIANHVLSLLHVELIKKVPASKDSKHEFQVALNCLRLSLPPDFSILSNPPQFDQNTFATCNWIMGTHLFLTTAYTVIEMIPPESNPASPSSASRQAIQGGLRLHEMSLTQIITRWPTDYIVLAHPFFVSMMLPVPHPDDRVLLAAKEFAAHNRKSKMSELMIEIFERNWKLASRARDVLQAWCSPGVDLVADQAVMKEFVAFFPRRRWTNSTCSPVPQFDKHVDGTDHNEPEQEACDFFEQIQSRPYAQSLGQLSALISSVTGDQVMQDMQDHEFSSLDHISPLPTAYESMRL